jgi:hypothetical protein
MKSGYLFILGISLASLVLAWTYSDCQDSFESAELAINKQDRCTALLRQIEALHEKSQSSLVVAPAAFDPAKQVIQAARKAGISQKNYSVNQTRLRKIDQTNIRQWGVGIPQTSQTLLQTMNFIRNLSGGDVQFQVGRIELWPDRQNSEQAEKWRSDLFITFMKQDQNP